MRPYNDGTMHHLGSTRSVSRREYLLHTPDAFVRTPFPGLTNGVAVVHAAPEMGADFAMATLELSTGGVLTEGPAQRLLYVSQGELILQLKGVEPHSLTAGSFSFLPQGTVHSLEARSASRVVLFEKHYKGENRMTQAEPTLLIGHESMVNAIGLGGDPDVQVRSLLPDSTSFDFAVNTMTYAPGASLSQVEVHYMEHGLLMLEGGGIYRLAKDWHPVEAGDAIWMAPFCPQWFAAVGKRNAKYIIYKNFNRHVLA